MTKMGNKTTKHFHRLGEIAKKKSGAAGAKIGASMKKALSFAGARAKKSSKIEFSREKVESDMQLEKPEQPKTEIEHETPDEPSHVDVPVLGTQECDSASPNVKGNSSNSSPSAKNQGPHEIAMECLTCENLVHCDFRSNSSEGPGRQVQNRVSCPSAKKLT